MDFLYPKFDSVTHTLKYNSGNSLQYPNSLSFDSKKDFSLPAGLKVSIIEQSLGYECKWSKVRIIDTDYKQSEYFNKNIFIENKNLINYSNKSLLNVICNEFNSLDFSEPEIDPNLKEIFIPYVDRRNGLYSVRIQSDYEKVLDSFTFDVLLNDIFYEGVSILLASRGYKSDNATIEQLINNYYNFAYINKDLDLTVTRRCEPLTFTVSIPLRFFNNFSINNDTQQVNTSKATKSLTFNNQTFINEIGRLTRLLTARAVDIENLIYPDKFIDGYVTDFEINSIKAFGLSFIKLMSNAGYPLKTLNLINYEIGLDDDLNLIFLKANINYKDSQKTEEILFNQALLSQFRLSAEFNSKRIFNYFLNISKIEQDIFNMDVTEFLETYVDYPKAKLETQKIVINDTVIPNQIVKEYTKRHDEQVNETLTLGDANNLLQESINATDTVYKLFWENQTRTENYNSVQNFKKNFFFVEENLKYVSRGELKDAKDDSISIQFEKGIEDVAVDLKNSVESNLNWNTVAYILQRINLKQALFQHLFCYLKNLDPNNQQNATEIANLLSQIPPEIVNYFIYLNAVKDLRGTEYVKALGNGLPLDKTLYTAKNDSLIYYVKGITKLATAINIIGTNTLKIFSSLANQKRSPNPFQTVTREIILAIERAVINEVLDIIRESIATSCENDLVLNQDNFQNPYNSHTPIPAFQGSTNYDQSRINQNRGDALTDTYNPLQYGFDREYTVNLLDNLLNDINCILTPIESVRLLQGTPTELVITLIKNIIRNKYSESPNDLSFLLSDNNKLLLFFKRLGLTVDENVLSQTEKIIVESNKISSTDICNPEYEKVRQELLNNKLPPELGILEDQLSKRIKKARKILEYIKAGEKTIDIASFCVDAGAGSLGEVKDYLISNYIKNINDTFSLVLAAFNQDVNYLNNKIIEKGNIVRTNEGKIFDVVEYNNYYADIINNLVKLSNFESSKSDEFAEILKINYKPINIETNLNLINGINTFSNSQLNGEVIFCEPKQQQIKNLDDFFNSGESIYIEFVREDYYFDSIDGYRGTDLQDGREDGTALSQELKNKDYFFAITCDAEATTEDIIDFKFYANDKDNNKYQGAKFSYQGKDVFPGIQEYSTENFYDNAYDVLKNYDDIDTQYNALQKAILASGIPLAVFAGITYEVFASLPFAFLFPATAFTAAGVALIAGIASVAVFLDKPKVYRITKEVFDKFDTKTKTIIIDFFNQSILTKIEELKQKRETEARIQKNLKTNLFSQQIFNNLSEEKTTNNVVLNAIITDDTNALETIKSIDYIALTSSLDVDLFNKSKDILTYSRLYSQINFKNGNAGSSGLEENQSNPNSPSNTDGYVDKRFFTRDFYKFLSDIFLSEIKSKYYFKNEVDYLKDFIYYQDKSNQPTFVPNEDVAKTYIADKDVKVTKNANASQYDLKYQSYGLFNIQQNFKEVACNVKPHYLNLDFFKNAAFTGINSDICDDTLKDHPFNEIKQILVNLTIRTYTTDLLIKLIPYLSLFNKDELENLYKNNKLTDTLFEFIKKDFEQISPVLDRTKTQNKYFKNFNYYVNETFDKYLENGKKNANIEGRGYIINRFYESLDCKDEYYKFKYFIKREIAHFIKFTRTKKILIPNEFSIFNTVYEKYSGNIEDTVSSEGFSNSYDALVNIIIQNLPNIAYDLPVANLATLNQEELFMLLANTGVKILQIPPNLQTDIPSYLKILINEDLKYVINNFYDDLSPYFLMNSTLDINKKSIFYGTKYELFNILAQLESSFDDEPNDYNSLDANSGDNEDLYDEQSKITDFINKMSKSSAPTLFYSLKPKYLKNIDFYIKASLETTNNIVNSVANSSDFNISLTNKIDNLTTISATAIWSLLDQKTRNNLIANATNTATLVQYKRLEDGKNPIPFFKIPASLAVWGETLIPPTPIGWSSLGLNAISETIYLYELYRKIQEERNINQDETNNLDPCDDKVKEQTAKSINYECTPENRVQTLKEKDKFEYIPFSTDVVTEEKC